MPSTRPLLHTTFEDVTIHTAKCDICNARNKAVLKRCTQCGWSVCQPCWADRSGRGDGTYDGSHLINEGDSGWTAERVSAQIEADEGKEKTKEGGKKKAAPKTKKKEKLQIGIKRAGKVMKTITTGRPRGTSTTTAGPSTSTTQSPPPLASYAATYPVHDDTNQETISTDAASLPQLTTTTAPTTTTATAEMDHCVSLLLSAAGMLDADDERRVRASEGVGAGRGVVQSVESAETGEGFESKAKGDKGKGKERASGSVGRDDDEDEHNTEGKDEEWIEEETDDEDDEV
ncbi:MAG: hypothetical protein M1833_006373 [Piccolia ochrophora]|nr:MAG: hypothetical protein M1833_006373 [Piccolia ochrophora]